MRIPAVIIGFMGGLVNGEEQQHATQQEKCKAARRLYIGGRPAEFICALAEGFCRAKILRQRFLLLLMSGARNSLRFAGLII